MSRMVRGHVCEGLDRFHEKGTDCAPIITNDGQIVGCEGESPVLISFCPFCGQKLDTVPDRVDGERASWVG